MKQILLGAALAVAVVLGIGALRGHSAPAGFTAVADDGGAMTAIAIHFDPRVVAEVGETYEDLLHELPSDVTVYVLVEKAADFSRLQELLATWHVARPDRFQSVVVGKRITTWSRDRYTLADSKTGPVLLVPPRPTKANPARENDWDAPFALADAVPGLRTHIADLVFEGGDMTVTSKYVFATAVLRERNEGGDLYDPKELRAWLRHYTGKEPIILGDTAADVPAHHIGMFVTPLDDHRIMVGDPDMGLALFDRSKSDASVLPYPIDRREQTLQRFRNVIAQLDAAGFELIRVPLVPLTDGLTYITYNNVLLEHRDGALHAYVPQFGLPAMDRAGRDAFAAAGVVVHPIRVANIYRYNGTVRCLVNIVRRASRG